MIICGNGVHDERQDTGSGWDDDDGSDARIRWPGMVGIGDKKENKKENAKLIKTKLLGQSFFFWLCVVVPYANVMCVTKKRTSKRIKVLCATAHVCIELLNTVA